VNRKTVNSYFSIIALHGAQRKQPARCPVAKDIAKHLFSGLNQFIIWQETPIKSEYCNSETASLTRLVSHGKWIRLGSLECVQRRSHPHIILHQCHTTDTKPGKLKWMQWESLYCEGEHRGKSDVLICSQCVSSRTTERPVDTCGNRPLDLWRWWSVS